MLFHIGGDNDGGWVFSDIDVKDALGVGFWDGEGRGSSRAMERGGGGLEKESRRLRVHLTWRFKGRIDDALGDGD